MREYKTSKDLTTDRLVHYGFVVDTIKEKAKHKKYLLYKKLTSDSHLLLTISQKGKRFIFNPNKSKIFVGNQFNYSCNPSAVNINYLGFPIITERYNEELNELVDNGILVKRLHRKKNK